MEEEQEWQPVNTIPLNTPVMIKSVKGIICKARCRGTSRWIRRQDRWGPRRVYCVRLNGKTSGDIVAVAWKSIT